MLAALVFIASSASAGQIEPGTKAPDFTLTDTDGQQVKLSDLEGKKVVLEWFNPGCPYVKYAHESGGPLEKLAADTTDEETVWLAINSGAPGKQGHGLETNKNAKTTWSMGHPVLLDESGETGKAYGATNTPQMFIIDEEGKVAYAGALDDSPMGRKTDGDPKNFVTMALEDIEAGSAPRVPKTQPYGCSVKYGS